MDCKWQDRESSGLPFQRISCMGDQGFIPELAGLCRGSIQRDLALCLQQIFTQEGHDLSFQAGLSSLGKAVQAVGEGVSSIIEKFMPVSWMGIQIILGIGGCARGRTDSLQEGRYNGIRV